VSTTSTYVDVDRPVRTVYDQWTQFEEFPQFMEGVESVQQLDDATLEWTAQIAGQRRAWTARIVDQVPDTRISWESTEGARNAGIVQFEALEDGSTRVFLDLDFEPDGLLEAAGDKLGFVRRRAEGDLQRFKQLLEAKPAPSGAWRGTIQEGETTRPDPAAMTGSVAAGAMGGGNIGANPITTTSGSVGSGAIGGSGATPAMPEDAAGTSGSGPSTGTDDAFGSDRVGGLVAGMAAGLSSGMGAGLGPETAGSRPAGEEGAGLAGDEYAGLDADDDLRADTTVQDRVFDTGTGASSRSERPII
jgi:hypothetical protein